MSYAEIWNIEISVTTILLLSFIVLPKSNHTDLILLLQCSQSLLINLFIAFVILALIIRNHFLYLNLVVYGTLDQFCLWFRSCSSVTKLNSFFIIVCVNLRFLLVLPGSLRLMLFFYSIFNIKTLSRIRGHEAARVKLQFAIALNFLLI